MNDTVQIICPFCGVGCNLEIHTNEDKIPVKCVSSGRNPELNGKYVCVKGTGIHEMLTSSERLTDPLIRKGGQLEKTTWDEALGTIASRLRGIIDKYGKESVGMLCSGKILNEDAYLCQKFQRAVIGNNIIDNCARLCHGPSEVALRKQLGFGAVSTYLDDFEKVDTFVIVGANTMDTYPVIWMRIRNRMKKDKFNLVVADPRVTGLSKYAGYHLRPNPGTDIYWIKALSKIMYSKGWHDDTFCRTKTLGYQAFLNSLESLSIPEACAAAGVDQNDLEAVAELIHGKKTVFIWGMGLTQHAWGTESVTALVNLALLTGNVGKQGCGLSPLRGQNNVQGASDMGALPYVLPGHMHLGDEAARIHIGAVWKSIIPSKPGLSAPEMIHEIADGKIRALYVVGENPVMSEPQSNFVNWMMQRLDLLIVQDLFLTETAKPAHIVLPAAAIGEKEGTLNNSARRIQYTSGGLTPPGKAKPDWLIFRDLAKAMHHDWNYEKSEDVWNEVREVIPIFAGVTYDRLKNSCGIFWPCHDECHPGTPRLYEDGFTFRDRRARFIPVYPPADIIKPTASYPYILITGRLMEHFNTGEMTRRSKRLMKLVPKSYIMMHPEDAEKEGLVEDTSVRVTSPYGAVLTHLKISDSISVGYLFAPNHFPSPNYNALMSAVPLDPQARMPALKVIPVHLCAI